MDSLDEVARKVRACTECPLSGNRTQAVPGEGPGTARIMFVGEAPGYHEDQQGRPFVGPAGRFLEELLGSIGLKREDVFIANMVKCRPPGNRDPLPAETAACSKYLDRQIELVGPDLIVTLGRYSLGKFFPNESITRVRGKVRVKDGLRVLPLLHPAAALHQQSLGEAIREDFKKIPQALEQLPEAPQFAESSSLETQQSAGSSSPETQQLSLF